MANKKFIVDKGENGVVKKTINFSADNSLSVRYYLWIGKKTTEEKMSFRFNISIGFIQQNIETGDYRYFIPDKNETIFPAPILISCLNDILIKVKSRMDSLNLFEHLLRQRPNSKWKVLHVTNVKVVLIQTSYILN